MPTVSIPSGARTLAIGRTTLLLDGADLRYVAVDGVELLRRVHVAVRDEAWNTLEPDELHVEVREADELLEIDAEAGHASAAADVAWAIRARASAAGEVSYAVELRPRAPFAFNRMGICVLHPPAACVGRRYRARTPDGDVAGTFAHNIGVQQIEGDEILPLLPSFSALHVEAAGGGEVALSFEGDLFELEDQRNWSDGSFKTYGTPLSLPRPQRAEPGRPRRQRVALAPPPAPAVVPRVAEEPVAIDVAPAPSGAVVPGIGLSWPPPDAPALAPDDPRLRALGLEHLRVDLRATERAAAQLDAAAAAALSAGAKLAVALHPRDADALAVLADALVPHAPAVARVLVFDPAAEASPGPLVAAARERLAATLPHARFAGGTDLWFAQLNRGRPDVAAMDDVAWSVSPQVHGSDALTIVEALEAQADQLVSARAFAPGLGLLVGPVSLRPRYNPAATDAAAQALDPPPVSIDPRQADLFAAAWTAGSLAQLAGAAAAATAVTYYETHGPRGVLAAGDVDVLPLWHPLADAGAWAGWEVLPAASAAPLAAQALAVRDPTRGRLGALISNVRDVATRVRVGGLPVGPVELRTLDAGTRAEACADPLAFRARWERRQVGEDGALALALGPHAVVTVRVGGERA